MATLSAMIASALLGLLVGAEEGWAFVAVILLVASLALAVYVGHRMLPLARDAKGSRYYAIGLFHGLSGLLFLFLSKDGGTDIAQGIILTLGIIIYPSYIFYFIVHIAAGLGMPWKAGLSAFVGIGLAYLEIISTSAFGLTSH